MPLPRLVLFLALAQLVTAQPVPASSLAYIKNDSLSIVAKHGEVLYTIVMRPPVSDFSVSRDRKTIVVVSNGTADGGDLEVIDLPHRRRSKLMVWPVYFKQENAGREVYAHPQISPDGRRVVVVVHSNDEGGADNFVKSAGPLATVELDSGKTQLVTSTMNIDGHGPCHANTPLWSPDGSRILFSCESGFAITHVNGSNLTMLSAGTQQKPWTAAIGWMGSRCILYVQAKDDGSYDTEVRLLNLATLSSGDASPYTMRQRAQIAGLSELSSDAAISRTSDVTIRMPHNRWVLPKSSPAHLLSGWTKKTIPAGCR